MKKGAAFPTNAAPLLRTFAPSQSKGYKQPLTSSFLSYALLRRDPVHLSQRLR
jgi:hypothetical protein